MNIEPRVTIVRWIAEARREIGKLGGWGAFKSGEWLPNLVRATFEAYYENANPEYLRTKYPRASDKRIIGKLTKIAARNAAIAGGITGAAVSIDEILALIASDPTGGLNLPTQPVRQFGGRYGRPVALPCGDRREHSIQALPGVHCRSAVSRR